MPALTAWYCRSGKKEWREAASADAVGSRVDMLAVAGDREADLVDRLLPRLQRFRTRPRHQGNRCVCPGEAGADSSISWSSMEIRTTAFQGAFEGDCPSPLFCSRR